MNRLITCAFTGHRPADLPDRGQEDARQALALKSQLKETVNTLIDQGVNCFCGGGALGFDTWAAEAVLESRRQHSHIRLHLILPCWGQEKSWQPQDQRRYRKIVEQADLTRFLASHYHIGCMQDRNRALVDGADVIVGYCTKKTGGTAYTLSYARRKKKRIILLNEAVHVNQTTIEI